MWWRGALLIDAVVLATATASCSSPSPVTPTVPPPAFSSTIPAPTPTAPIGVTVGLRPRFTVNNVRAFPGCTAYKFDVSLTPSFQSLLTTATVNEEIGQTSFIPSADLPAGTLYWRAQTVKNSLYCPPPEAPSAFSSTQWFTVVQQSAYIDPPKLVSPINGSQGETRPRFTIGNSRGSDPSATFAYRFDLSPSPTFGGDVVSATFPEGYLGGPQPGFTQTPSLPQDLLFDTTYYWRAQAINSQNHLTSPFSPTFTYSTYGPRPGLSMLHVFIPGCNDGIGVTFDGHLSNDGTMAQFVDSVSLATPPLTLELSRGSNGWSGSVSGYGEARGIFRVRVSPRGGSAVVPARASEASGQFSGTFDAAVNIWNQFGDGGDGCADEFRWVILPPK